VKGTTTGTMTGDNGAYSINVPEGDQTLVFSFIGMQTQEVTVTGEVANCVMQTEESVLEDVVVTALGISRDKKSLGYAIQEVSGDDISAVKSDNFVNSISGKVSGVQIKANGNMGGSTNVVIRGSSSLTGDNQALFIIDGIPVNNSNTNSSGQLTGRNGYDYGNTASDINPNDIESVSVLKGAAATALYGARGANGVILITTKKGAKNKGIGIKLSSNFTLGVLDKSTFPKYQTNYGASYGPYYSDSDHPELQYYDFDGDGTDDYVVPTTEDASMGARFDPNLMVYQWDAFYAESPNYMKKTPWTVGANGPETFFQNSKSYNNTVELSGGNDNGAFRLSYTNMDQTGIMPNSSLKKNNFNLNSSYDLTKNLKISGSANYINTKGKGRNSTGYSDNIMSSFRQWFQMNVDIKAQEDMFNQTGQNITWNPHDEFTLVPEYWDNPYWVRYKNYETDERNRLIGYAQADWKITDYFSVTGRSSIDTYDEIQEERKAVGSVAGEFGVDRPDVQSGYSVFRRNFIETNTDLFGNVNKTFGDISFTGMLGLNIRRNKIYSIYASTNGGLAVPEVYSLANTAQSLLAPEEEFEQVGINGIYATASIGYKNFFFLDGTIRRDQSSTLPENNDTYYYPSVSTSLLFSNLLNMDWLQLGKVRLNYAEVGNDAPYAVIKDNYLQNTAYNGNGSVTLPSTKNNPDLKSERTKSIEAGLEMKFLKNRLGFDFAWYKMNTVDQIMPLAVSPTTGYSFKYVNAGEIQNSGIELQFSIVPVQLKNLRWEVVLNWAKNQNKVVSLANGVDNLQIASLQGGITINARKGEPYGTIQGTDYEYYSTGKPIIQDDGYYLKSATSDKVIGNINPDWNGGISNTLSYKNFSFSFLIDMQKGGSVFSLDQYYGLATGVYDVTDYTNDLGNPVRDAVVDNGDGTYGAESGGLILDGVFEDGTLNNIRIAGDYYAFGYENKPNSAFVFDASYVKLREVVLSYTLPKSISGKYFSNITVGFVGSNLWIISKNLKYADPEAGQSAGNIQGWQSGVMPSTRNFGFNLSLQF
jgi:TonB-linked SusC/RagA family outer membrane protein